MANDPALLKSSVFGGFKKKDVLSYIFELNESTQEEKQKLAEQMEELLQSRESLSLKVTEMEQQVAALQISLDEVSERLEDEMTRNEQSSQLIEKLKAEVSKHESTVSQQNSEITRLTELSAKLTEKNRAHEEKRHQVELAASQIADLLGQARDDAASVVDRAKLEAENIVNNAKTSIEAHVEEANNSIDAAYSKFGTFKLEIEALHKTFLDASAAMADKAQSLRDAVTKVEKLAPEKLSADNLPTLQYKEEDPPEVAEAKNVDPATSAAISPAVKDEAAAADMTNDILRRYGVRKDESGFFRLASDK